MATFNLIDGPWVPREVGAQIQEAGLRETLLTAHHSGEIQCASPLETVALLRLLLAILYRACGPRDLDEWAALWESGRLPAASITAYLDRWHDRFDLYSETAPFLQIPGLRTTQPTPLSALPNELQMETSRQLFEWSAIARRQTWPPAEAARLLLAVQGFALGFGKASAAVVGDETLPRPYLADGICLRGVTLWLSGQNLFQTLLLNLIAGQGEPDDLPPWERDDALELLDRAVTQNGKLTRVRRRAKGFVDRCVWQSRMVRLLPEPDGTVASCYITQGREADKNPGDPMKSYAQSRTEGIYARGLSADKAAWRDLHSYLAADKWKSPILGHVDSAIDEGFLPLQSRLRLNVVGLATDPGKAGKFLLWRHDRMGLPAALLADAMLMSYVGTAMEDAEFVARELSRRTKEVLNRFLERYGKPDSEDSKPDPKAVQHLLDALNPTQVYWARLEEHFAPFLDKLPGDSLAAVAGWREDVAGVAKEALRGACDQLGDSVRAIKATAVVRDGFTADAALVQQRIENAKARKRARKGDATA